eukprot:GFYU01009048.1.p1 GENE.GFYU01009048.1~~GFYU01009048.1.p1  ORF type:complete len:370 (-),score=56.30 GFYU01009048.1:35-1144(-)
MNIFTILLIALYALLILTCVVQISRILYYRHNLISYQVGFLAFCLMWTTFRVAFWSISTDADATLSLVLFWLPINIEFATFSLLALYYAHLVQILKRNKAEWESHLKRKYFLIYVVVNVILFLLNATWVAVAVNKGDVSKHMGNVHSCFSGAVFLVLVLVLAVFGWQVSHANLYKVQTPFQAKQATPRVIKGITLTIFICFFTRCVFNFLSLANIGVEVIHGKEKSLSTVGFLLYVLWEVMPTALVLVFFRKIPKTRLGSLNRLRESLTSSGRDPAPKPPPIQESNRHLFDNPQRYDSDDDTERAKGKTIPRLPMYPPPTPGSGTPLSYGSRGAGGVSYGSKASASVDASYRNNSYGSPSGYTYAYSTS